MAAAWPGRSVSTRRKPFSPTRAEKRLAASTAAQEPRPFCAAGLAMRTMVPASMGSLPYSMSPAASVTGVSPASRNFLRVTKLYTMTTAVANTLVMR